MLEIIILYIIRNLDNKPENTPYYPHIIIWQGNSEHSDWFFLGQDFGIRTISMETVEAAHFLFLKAGKLKISIARVPYNKLLTNLASSSRTGEYWPLVIFVRTECSPYKIDQGPIFPSTALMLG